MRRGAPSLLLNLLVTNQLELTFWWVYLLIPLTVGGAHWVPLPYQRIWQCRLRKDHRTQRISHCKALMRLRLHSQF